MVSVYVSLSLVTLVDSPSSQSIAPAQLSPNLAKELGPGFERKQDVMWTPLASLRLQGVIHMQKRLNVDALSGLGLVPVCIRRGSMRIPV